ncbi:MAG: histidine phosphatase family protein [Chloroflexi bacterium]|nr:histidine phosphatase family protein [Chloroflexota bacterium]MBI3761394.1 histidine phosphatase family protein [Chloroflexota bacterium]
MNTAPMLRLLLIRHGETDWSRERRFCGRSDPPLNERGIQQAEVLAERLRGENLAAGYTSPSRRSRQTADTLRVAAQLGVTFIERVELREQDFGEWEGRLPEEIARQAPALWSAWQSGQVPEPHGGELLAAVAERAQHWVSEVARSCAGGTVAAVAHGGVLQAMLCVLLGTPLRPLWPYRLAPGGVAEVWLYPLGAVLICLSKASPLET